MADWLSPEIRSYIMSKIKSKDTKPELLVRKYLHHKGYRYRIHLKNLPGKPDIVLKKYQTVIFIHGCFWHGHARCKNYKPPKSNTEYWENKINRNKSNFVYQKNKLHDLGWNIITIWECQLSKKKIIETLTSLEKKIKKQIP